MNFQTKIKKQEKSIIEIIVTMPFNEIIKNKERAIKKLSTQVEIDGFRKGKAPTEVVEAKIGKDGILQEASQQTINIVFPEIIKKEKIKMIGYPSIIVTKIDEKDEKNGFEFKIELTVYPNPILPDYKKIAEEIKGSEIKKVTQEDIEKVEQRILVMQNKMSCQGQHKENEKCEHKDQTELTDEFVQKIGPFKTVKEFKEKVKEDLEKENKNIAIAEHRTKLIESILNKIENFDVPQSLTNAETEKLVAQMKDDMVRNGIKWNEYLEQTKKNENDLKREYESEGIRRAKIEIILKKIANEEDIEADEVELKKQEELIKKTYPNTDPKNIRLYIENILINEAVLKFLENLSKSK